MNKAIFMFGIFNLPLRSELRCGPFTLTPRLEGQAELAKRRTMDSDPVWSADGSMPLPDSIDISDPWTFIETQPVHELELLLSFAERRYVEIVWPQVHRVEDGKSSLVSSRHHLPDYGNPHGVPWHDGHTHLKDFYRSLLANLG